MVHHRHHPPSHPAHPLYAQDLVPALGTGKGDGGCFNLPLPPTQRPTLLFPHPRTAQDLVPALGIGKGDGGFDLAELMEWVGKTYNSANGEVRSTAVRVTKEVHDLVGPALR